MGLITLTRQFVFTSLLSIALTSTCFAMSTVPSDYYADSKEEKAVESTSATKKIDSENSQAVATTAAVATTEAVKPAVVKAKASVTKPTVATKTSVPSKAKESIPTVSSNLNKSPTKAAVISENTEKVATESTVDNESVDDDSAGKVVRVIGRATVTSGNGEIQEVIKGGKLNPFDLISTSSRSFVRMKMKDKSYIMVRPDSRLSIDNFKYDKKKRDGNKGTFSLLKGGFRAVSGLIQDKRKYRYRTAVATIGIRGTEFSVRVCSFDCYDVDPLPKNGLFLEVHDKEVIVTTKTGDYSFTRGQFAYVANNNTPAILLDSVPDVFDQAAIPSATPDCDK